jgi:hypothetical protein
VVRREIDVVIPMNDIAELVAYAGDASHSPEARLLAGGKAEVIIGGSVDSRQKRPRGYCLEDVIAITAALDSQGWRSWLVYGSLVDDHERAVKRPAPLDDSGWGCWA